MLWLDKVLGDNVIPSFVRPRSRPFARTPYSLVTACRRCECCIDQNDISANLRCLPVFLYGCKKLVVSETTQIFYQIFLTFKAPTTFPTEKLKQPDDKDTKHRKL